MLRKILLIVILASSLILFAEELLLDVMFTNDIHGGIDRYKATFMNPQFPPMLGGGGSAATYINSVRAKANGISRSNLLVDAGDFFQGHPVGTVTDGRAVIDYMNSVGYDVLVIGNHEFDIGEERLVSTLNRADFPILSCNIVKKGTTDLVDYVSPYIMREILGVKIAIIGLTTTDTALMSFPENISNVDFLPAKPALEKYVKIVKDEGADIIIVVGHMGLPYDPEPSYESRYLSGKEVDSERRWGYDAQETVHEVEGIDVFFGGHMHKGFNEAWEDPDTHTLVFQGYAYGSNVGHVTLKIDSETKSLAGYESPAIREGVLVTMFEDEFIPNELVGNEILAQQAIAEEGMDDVIGQAAIYLSKSGNGAQNLIGNMVCEAMINYTGADFAFMNLGGVRGDIARGHITYRDVFNVMPFDNQIVMAEVDGKFLKEIIEARVAGGRHGLRVAGVKVVYSKKRDNNDRVTLLEVNGEPWSATKIYTITTTDFLLQGNAGLVLLTKIPEEKITRYEMGLRDAIVEYIERNSPISTKIDDRWKRDDKSIPNPSMIRELMKISN